MLPNVLEDFLDSLTYNQVDASKCAPLLSLSSGLGNQYPDGSFAPQQPLELFQKHEANLSYDACSRRIHEELVKKGHPVSKQIIDALLCCSVFAESGGSARLAFLNYCVASIRVFSVSHYFLTSLKGGVAPFKHHGYTVGTLGWDRFASRCRRAGSDFAELYQGKVGGRIALETPEFDREIVDFIGITLKRGLEKNSKWREIILFYFEAIAEEHIEMMWGQLEKEQAVDEVLGLGCIDSSMFREKLANNAQEVAIYLNPKKDRAGYVVPRQRAVVVSVGPGKDSPQASRVLRPNESEHGQAAAECALHLQQAGRFLRAGRFSDSALYSTIALERVFTRKDRTVEAVTTRTAMLSYVPLSRSLKECQGELVKLYEARSGFVHQGARVSQNAAEKLLEYGRHVLRTMLWLQRSKDSLEDGFIKAWVSRLDAAYASLEAGLPMDDEILKSLGVYGPKELQ